MKSNSDNLPVKNPLIPLKRIKAQPFEPLNELFGLTHQANLLHASSLNKWAAKLQGITHEFVCQSELADNLSYYEQIINQQSIIPTRPDSWHDLFNGLIWLQYPKTKKLLNQWHMQDIEQYGLTPRTARRNRITHFDECGVVLAVVDKQISGLLAEHHWQQAFVQHRPSWGKQIKAFIFGHANLEMMLKPFIGLTGKWLAVEVTAEFFKLEYGQQVSLLDTKLAAQLQAEQPFSQAKSLRPLPLLGVPDWWDDNQHPEFYRNTDYFRPKCN
ncbi:DUF3025 domain-containing protein [Aliiglaciecola sp. LCG003]|uniref:DUF3025 domain-containing protein n=1 Tax=Aliiglaciecola sp. LCG003 TaxID=3053655 RepID=UPI0025723156|nr:DUF3025 domain-containing protein [Aliiglaciecola sp. LCG003]WJG08269.1 DUF3025 domain-containing protein [Aliiglaciecola sp. LCG003]